MIGRICLQGGAEFTDPCREMDQTWQQWVGRGTVLVLPLASSAGTEYRVAGNNGREYLESLGFEDVSVAAEPGVQLDRVVRSIVHAHTVVLPGGSPARIRQRTVGTAVGAALRAHIAGGGAIVGASAGAMVLTSWMVLPGRDNDVHRGLGLLRDLLVLPHFEPGVGPDAQDTMVARVRSRLHDDVVVLGIPECSGVFYDNDKEPVAVGAADSWRFLAGTERERVSRG